MHDRASRGLPSQTGAGKVYWLHVVPTRREGPADQPGGVRPLVEVHTRVRGRYGSVLAVGRGQPLRPLAFLELAVSRGEILG